ncbi:hypothetical protein AABC73_15030 [Pseudomonas sp. G.S.17]|uniref:hypothetical protein n=1 Tax=Pseudomonas sp. G.S.17 TaxID=3137451 RepID=UPI00311CAC0F
MSGLGFGVSLEPLDPKSHDEDDQDTIQRYKNISDSAIAAPTILSAWQAIQSDALSASVRRLTESVLKTPDDKAKINNDTEFMSDITREEFNAKIETIETKMDARVESVSAKIDAFMAVQAERDRRLEATVNRIDTSHDQIKSAFGSMKTTIIVTAVSTVLAIVIGIGGFNAMLTSNMISSFQMGRSELAVHKAVEQATPAQPAAPPAQQK